jgi:phosphopantetheinyl transferase
MLIARKRIEVCHSSLAEDIPRATPKRIADHNSGRLLLEECLIDWGVPIDSVEVLRTEERAPYLSWLDGIWRNEPLPGISIGHSGEWAVCALIEPGYWIGIDAEPKNRGIKENAFDMMAKGKELDWLKSNPDQAIRIWTAKEAVQKAERMGMHLNPRDIVLEQYLVESFIHEDQMVSISWRKAGNDPETPEDNLLQQTKTAMQSTDSWGVGCNTTRNNV